MKHEQSETDLDEDLAQWLVESGRRRTAPDAPRPVNAGPQVPEAKRRSGAAARRWDRVVLFGLLAVAYLMYFIADALLQINALPSLIVFVPAG
jgi:hypothetical protein